MTVHDHRRTQALTTGAAPARRPLVTRTWRSARCLDHATWKLGRLVGWRRGRRGDVQRIVRSARRSARVLPSAFSTARARARSCEVSANGVRLPQHLTPCVDQSSCLASKGGRRRGWGRSNERHGKKGDLAAWWSQCGPLLPVAAGERRPVGLRPMHPPAARKRIRVPIRPMTDDMLRGQLTPFGHACCVMQAARRAVCVARRKTHATRASTHAQYTVARACTNE